MAFHVPELARDTTHPVLGSTREDGNNGAFFIESPEPGWRLTLIASDGLGWEHVSAHARRGDKMRTPTWREMAYVKNLCWDDEDIVVQFHPRKSEYVNCHPHVLHLWRPLNAVIPTPHPLMVGVRTLSDASNIGGGSTDAGHSAPPDRSSLPSSFPAVPGDRRHP